MSRGGRGCADPRPKTSRWMGKWDGTEFGTGSIHPLRGHTQQCEGSVFAVAGRDEKIGHNSTAGPVNSLPGPVVVPWGEKTIN